MTKSNKHWGLYQYHVDFAPEEDRTIVRKGLLRLHKEKLGAYIFDGTVMYTSTRLPEVIALFFLINIIAIVNYFYFFLKKKF